MVKEKNDLYFVEECIDYEVLKDNLSSEDLINLEKVLEICDDYNIDYNNKGFKETNNETIKGFYMRIFDEFDVDANSIFFENKNDSSFELVVSDRIKVDISKNDKLMDVLNNVEYIRKELEKKKTKEEFELN